MTAALLSREWLDTGRAFNSQAAEEGRDRGYTRELLELRIVRAVDAFTWHEPVDGIISGPMSPVMALQEIIEQLDLRHVVAYAYNGPALNYPDGPETASYGMLGVEIKSSKQHFRLHLLGHGVGCVPIFIDWYQQ